MSRTKRRKAGIGWCYGVRTVDDALVDTVYLPECYDVYYIDIHVDPRSTEGRKRIAKFHSDASYMYNRAGPNWYAREFFQRPYRRDAARQIQKAMRDSDYEVIIRNKPMRDWWD